jgi:hypothetical protein
VSPEQEALTARVEMAVRDVLEPHLNDATFEEQCASYAWLLRDGDEPGSFMHIADLLDLSDAMIARIRMLVLTSDFAQLPRVRRA